MKRLFYRMLYRFKRVPDNYRRVPGRMPVKKYDLAWDTYKKEWYTLYDFDLSDKPLARDYFAVCRKIGGRRIKIFDV